MALLVLVEYAKEALLEDGRGEGVGEHDDTVCRVGHRLHLQQADLVKAAGEQVDDVTVVRSPLRQSLVELQQALQVIEQWIYAAHLVRPLEVLSTVALDVVVRTDRLLELVADD